MGRHELQQPLLTTHYTSHAGDNDHDHGDDDPALKGNLQPVPPSLRSYTAWDFASFWIGVATSIPMYYMAGALIELGMSWWQGLLNIALANAIQLVCVSLLGHPGTRYGIPFPVLSRASFGTRGAHFTSCVRGLIACGWFGIETWIGGQAVFVFLNSLCNGNLSADDIGWLGTSLPKLLCFLAFWTLQLGCIWYGIPGIRYLQTYSAPVLILLCSGLLLWAYLKAGGFGEMLSASSQFGKGGAKEGQFWSVWNSALTANISSFASLSLSISDFTRYAKSQADQVLGHFALPLALLAFSFIGLAVSSSTETIFGYIISNPVELLGQIGGVIPTLVSLFSVTLVVLTTNVVNIVAPTNALININPVKVSFRLGALLSASVAIFMQPWRLFRNGETFINKWLLGYSFIVGPLITIVIIDYYILRRCRLDLQALYSSNMQPYWYYKGYNIKAFIAFLVGAVPNIPGYLCTVGVLKSVIPVLLTIYQVSFFSSFILTGVCFLLLSVIPIMP